MRLIVDTDSKQLTIDDRSIDLYSREAFEALSNYWVKLGWNEKYSYTFTWLGCPIIQLPEDLLRMQELIYRLKPDVIIETGVAHGGSLIFYASLCHVLGKGRVIGVDIKIHDHNRETIIQHELNPYITLIEGDSTALEIVNQVKEQLSPNQKTLVILDSNHTYDHVTKELWLYADLVTSGSYLVVMDGIMTHLHDVPRGEKIWKDDNPAKAASNFAAQRDDFVVEQPSWVFNESQLNNNISYCVNGWLKKL